MSNNEPPINKKPFLRKGQGKLICNISKEKKTLFKKR